MPPPLAELPPAGAHGRRKFPGVLNPLSGSKTLINKGLSAYREALRGLSWEITQSAGKRRQQDAGCAVAGVSGTGPRAAPLRPQNRFVEGQRAFP